MILKDDELMIIGLINEDKIGGNVQIKEVKSVFYDLIQVGPMYRTFVQQLEKNEVIGKGTTDEMLATIEMSYYDVF